MVQQGLFSSVFSVEMGAALCCCSEKDRIHQEPSTSVIRAQDVTPPIGKLLIFVNPNSGAGKAVQTFNSKVVTQLEKNNIQYELVTTTAPNQARKLVSSRNNITDFNGIMILSGDGLIYEVINGLCERSDAARVVPSMPIAIVPSGSGNGLLSSSFASKGCTVLGKLSNFSWSLKNPAFTNQAILVATSKSPEAHPVNLLHVQTPRENLAGFLSLGWGLMADIDIESERYRKTLGSNRFTVSAVVRCLSLRTYKARLSYKLYEPSSSSTSASNSLPFPVFQKSRKDEEEVSITIEESGYPRPRDVFWSSRQVVPAPELEKPLPEDWTTIEDEFVGVYAISLSHIAQDGHFMPGAKLDDDKIYLTYVLKRDISSKAQLMKMLLALEKGTHVKLSYFKTVHVTSFRLIPEDPTSRLVVDGEVVDATSLQITVTDLKTAVFI